MIAVPKQRLDGMTICSGRIDVGASATTAIMVKEILTTGSGAESTKESTANPSCLWTLMRLSLLSSRDAGCQLPLDGRETFGIPKGTLLPERKGN